MGSSPRHKSIQALAFAVSLLLVCCSFALPHGALSIQDHSHQFESQYLNSETNEQGKVTTANGVEREVSRLAVDASPALLVIDVQNCFLPGGAIPVSGGDAIIPIINSIRERYYFRAIVRRLSPSLALPFSCPYVAFLRFCTFMSRLSSLTNHLPCNRSIRRIGIAQTTSLS